MLLNATDFIKHSGKSKPAMYKALKQGRLTKTDCGRFDTEDPDCIAYCESHKRNTGVRSPQTTPPDNKPQKPTRKSVTSSHRGKSRAELEEAKLIQQVVKLELDNEIKIGNYIPREMVEEKLIKSLNDFLIKMLADLPRTLVMAIRSSIDANMTDGEVEIGARDVLESHVKRLKNELKRGLK